MKAKIHVLRQLIILRLPEEIDIEDFKAMLRNYIPFSEFETIDFLYLSTVVSEALFKEMGKIDDQG